ncbi:snRNA-activating protein complex subunit 2 [Megalops cyprinoides]|uniref:snRNA-activating protein complex subunit 2 n=1 Tax=Megalops cyprinoides TaxID=118141 RepID=UPI0018648495|nr:snRNA-activating protein complex subunit 2 [Megalops cyprinoides]XP_036404444.1 snRNA-activating protein complex subunit 2 [Megalops cyprinoides]
MKPPARKRNAPQRFICKQAEQRRHARARESWCVWKTSERRRLLIELRKQRDRTELDVAALQAKLPKRSVEEIDSLVRFLKGKVAKRVSRYLYRRRQEEERAKVPIVVWSEMAQRMAGSLEGAISSAFSQMLVIAATEPCSLLNSDPPRPLKARQDLPADLRTVPPRPMPRLQAETPSQCGTRRRRVSARRPSSQTPKAQALSQWLKGQPQRSTRAAAGPGVVASACDLLSPSTGSANTAAATPQDPSEGGSASAGAADPPLLAPGCAPENPNQQGATSAQSSPSTQQAAVADIGGPAQGAEQSSSSTGQGPASAQQTFQRPLKQKDFVVNFKNIYHFLNAVNKQGKRPPLTAMESAVILDLLLSLPEEIPLLDCEGLQEHMWEMHARLTAPVPKPRPPESSSQEGHPQPDLVSGDAPSGTRTQDGEISSQNGGEAGQLPASVASHSSGRAVSVDLTEGKASCSSEKAPTNQESNCATGHVDGVTPEGQKRCGMECTGQSKASSATAAASRQPGAGPQPARSDQPGAQNPAVHTAATSSAVSQSAPHTTQQSTSQPHSANPPAQSTVKKKADWAKAGVCPLNPFMIPMKLLVRKPQPPEG